MSQSAEEARLQFEISRATYQTQGALYDYVAYSGASPGPAPVVLAAIAPSVPASGRVVPVVVTPSLPPPVSPPVAVSPPSPVVSPAPEPFRPTGPPASGGTAYESTRARVERVMRDTARRRAAPRAVEKVIEGEILRRGAGAIGRAILGPIGGIIWGIVTPGKLGSGEVSPEELMKNREREHARREREESILSEIGRDIFRGGAIGGAGIVIGGGVLIDQIAKHLPPIPLPDPRGDEPPVKVEVPRVEIPAPKAPSSSPLPLPPAPVPKIATPSPTSSPTPTSSPSSRSSRAPRPSPRSAPAPIPGSLGSPFPNIANLLGNRRSSATRPRTAAQNRVGDAIATQPATTVSPFFGDPLTMPSSIPAERALTSPASSPLTAFQPQVLGSRPPTRIRTRTRTKECQCDPKPRKPKRECRASASVVWAGGPNKGKIAGRRCYSFVGGK